MSDVIFHELHEYHRELWGFLVDNPVELKFRYIDSMDFPGSLFSLIDDHCSCFACVYAAIINNEKYRAENFCYFCPITSWRKKLIHPGSKTTPCIDLMEYRDFIHFRDKLQYENASKMAKIIMNLEWSIPEGFEI
jgi:hypothetical protein